VQFYYPTHDVVGGRGVPDGPLDLETLVATRARAPNCKEADMDRIPRRTKAERETLLRFDEDEHVLWASTATPRVATRWQRAGYPIRVLGRSSDGVPQSWEVKLAGPARKQSWLRLLSLALSQWHAVAPASAPAPPRARGVGRARRMTAPRNALAHAPRPPRGAAAGVRALRPASRRAAAGGPHNVGLHNDDRNVEPLEQM
jgi:hypothetical protein